MESPAEISFDEECNNNEWPDDYFNVDPEAPEHKKTTIFDFPIEILRKIVEPLDLRDRVHASRLNRAIYAAVATSHWKCPGDGTLSIYVNEFKQAFTHLHLELNFGGSFQVRALLGSNAFIAHEKNLICPKIPHKQAEHFIDRLNNIHRLFSKMQVRLLSLKGDGFDNDDLRWTFEKFVDDVTFDKLSVTLYNPENGKLTERLQELIRRARNEVEIKMKILVLTPEQMLSFHRPVTFKFWGKEATLSEELFAELVSRGHSLLGFKTTFIPIKTLKHIVDQVICSKINQKLDIRSLNYHLCREFCTDVGAALVYHPGAQDAFPRLEGQVVTTFKYCTATIFLRTVWREGQSSKVVVTSDSYKESV